MREAWRPACTVSNRQSKTVNAWLVQRPRHCAHKHADVKRDDAQPCRGAVVTVQASSAGESSGPERVARMTRRRARLLHMSARRSVLARLLAKHSPERDHCALSLRSLLGMAVTTLTSIARCLGRRLRKLEWALHNISVTPSGQRALTTSVVGCRYEACRRAIGDSLVRVKDD